MNRTGTTVVETLSENATSFADKYLHDANFIQRYNVWASTIDNHTKSINTAYDMGCGAGIFSVYLALKGIQTKGFDGAEGMIELCNRAKEERHLSNVEFEQAMLPMEDYADVPKVDLIISSSVIEYIDELNSTLVMFHDLLKPNGKLIISFPNKDAIYRKMEVLMYKLFRKPNYFRYVKNIWDKAEAEKLFNGVGFNLVEHFYFSDQSLISGIAGIVGGDKYAGNLTMMVLEKRK